jgi:hypothetical protein
MRRIVIAVAVATAASSLASQTVADTPTEPKARRSTGGANSDAVTVNVGTGMSKAVKPDALTVKQTTANAGTGMSNKGIHADALTVKQTSIKQGQGKQAPKPAATTQRSKASLVGKRSY